MRDNETHPPPQLAKERNLVLIQLVMWGDKGPREIGSGNRLSFGREPELDSSLCSTCLAAGAPLPQPQHREGSGQHEQNEQDFDHGDHREYRVQPDVQVLP